MDYHDVLAAVGAGSAHPGGFASTQVWVRELELKPHHHVLDVGCGTGRTLLYLNQQFGCKVTGVDVRPAMIEKAKARAQKAGQRADWRVASAERLPFRNDSFHFVITESVNVFVNPARALAEYFRVLKRPGTYVDVEMMRLAPVSDAWRETVRRLYGARHVPDLKGWRDLYNRAGFSAVKLVAAKPIHKEDALGTTEDDGIDVASPGAFDNPEVLKVLAENATWLQQCAGTIGYVISICRK